jgi:DNA-binding CsgD family transcriptional regulator
MKSHRGLVKARRQSRKRHCSQPGFFVFCDKSSGSARFRVKAGSDGKMPMDQAAGLLAIHCLIRGRSPKDFTVMVPAREDVLKRVLSRAEKLVEASRALASPVSLSRRENQVLRNVLECLTNKEIGAKLNLSERTVKFHVSSLLAKFAVHGRVDLIREFANLLVPESLPAIAGPLKLLAEDRKAPGTRPRAQKADQDPSGTEGPLRPAVRALSA